MPQQEVVRLFRAAQSDQKLRDRLNAAPDIEAFVKAAKKSGYDFTENEWKAATGFAVEELKCELSEIPGI